MARDADRDARLAAALRENLKRRKARARSETSDPAARTNADATDDQSDAAGAGRAANDGDKSPDL